MENKKIKSNKQERAIAKELGGRVVTGSGCLWHSKGDSRTDDFLIEAKTTKNKYYKLNVETWLKIEKEATRDGMRRPLLQVDLEDGKDRLVIMNVFDFLAMDLDSEEFAMAERKPLEIETKSYKLEYILYEIDNVLDDDGYYKIIRKDIRFTKYKKHLAILDWEDFLQIIEKL